MIMIVEVESGSSCPFRFSSTDSKSLVRWLAEGHSWRIELPDHIGSIAEKLSIDISTLDIVGTEEYTLEEYISWAGDDPLEQERARKAWDRDHARNINAWQSPFDMSGQLASFLSALGQNPSVYTDLGIETPYFVNGYFRQDLEDLLVMANWAKDNDEKRVCLRAV
jgi:hypothetical protein